MSGTHRREHHTHDDVAAHEGTILELLRADGGRVTTGRRAIVRALLTGPDHHVTAEDVAHVVQEAHPDVHLSTVYRTLDALERLGVVDRVNLGLSGAVYHLTDHSHHHLVCEVCGAVVEVPEDLFAPLGRAIDERYRFQISNRHLSLTGRCESCR